MKGSEYLNLPAGTLVRLRLTGYGARDPRTEDDIEVARIVNVTRYLAPKGRWHKFEDITFDGRTLHGAGYPNPDGDHRLVQVEKRLPMGIDPENMSDPWWSGGALRLVSAREVIGVWTDEVEAVELAQRAERFAARKAAAAAAAESHLRQLAQTSDELARILPVLEEAGVRKPSYTPEPIDRVFTVSDMAAVVDLLKGGRDQ